MREQTCGRVAPANTSRFCEASSLANTTRSARPFVLPSSLDDAVGFRHVVRRSADRHADPARPDLADSHRLTFAEGPALNTSAASDSGGLGVRPEVRKLVDGDFQLLREIQGDFGVRDVGPGFDCVNGLAAHAYAACQVGRADAPALADFGQAALNARSFMPISSIGPLRASVVYTRPPHIVASVRSGLCLPEQFQSELELPRWRRGAGDHPAVGETPAGVKTTAFGVLKLARFRRLNNPREAED